jgi:chromosome segregation ATPase
MGTINQFGLISQTLCNKMEGFEGRFDHFQHSLEDTERHLERMERRLDTMEHRMDNLLQGTESLETRIKTVNGNLLEVIRREQVVMQEIGDLVSRCHE